MDFLDLKKKNLRRIIELQRVTSIRIVTIISCGLLDSLVQWIVGFTGPVDSLDSLVCVLNV